MSRFGINEADNYGNSGSSFFQLKNDKDTARVRFMYNDINDVDGYAVHEVNIDGKIRFVNCMREYNEPKDKCPMCREGHQQKVKLYIPLYDVETGEVKLWERGKTFFSKLSSICSHYANSGKPLCAYTFEIERNGKPKDTNTTYEIFPMGDADDTTLADLPEVPAILGGILLNKTTDELDEYVKTGYFPEGGVERRGDAPEPAPQRRTPATAKRSDEAF